MINSWVIPIKKTEMEIIQQKDLFTLVAIKKEQSKARQLTEVIVWISNVLKQETGTRMAKKLSIKVLTSNSPG